MRIITDFHLHSRFSRACSQALTIPNIAKACERKGIGFVGTSDITHPAWRKEVGQELEEIALGTYCLRDGSSCTRFLLSTEISCIYKRVGKVRRVHHVLTFSSLAAVDRFISALETRKCNLKADGRPIIGLDSEELLKILLECDPQSLLIPAHAWTPWFSVFGSQSGFDSLEECFGEFTKHIHAIETGLSSDPGMNRRLSALDDIFLVSNSDAHSLDKLGREANIFEMTEPSYAEFRRILVERDVTKFLETIEFFPEEGKYHIDGHRECSFSCEPKESKRLKKICPKCSKPLTVGVMHRIDDLADREELTQPASFVPYRSIVPLAELIGDVLDKGVSTKAVRREVDRLLTDGRNEFAVLLDIPISSLDGVTLPEIAEAIRLMRAGEIEIKPGFDGEYGKISVASRLSRTPSPLQQNLVI